MIAARGVSAALVLVALAACSEPNKQTYAQAAVGTVGALAAVGIYRAITHDCWARCSPGYLCDEESGLCELAECVPGCEYGTHCVRDGRGLHCASDFGNQPITSSISAVPPVAAPAPLDAGAGVDASSIDASSDGAAAPP